MHRRDRGAPGHEREPLVVGVAVGQRGQQPAREARHAAPGEQGARVDTHLHRVADGIGSRAYAGRITGRPGARLPRGRARGRARLPRPVRPLPAGGPVHRGLRRGGDRGPLRAPHAAHVLPAAPAPDRAHVPRPAAALPGRDGVARPARLRPRGLELERVGARRHPRRGRRARLLLPQPVPLRVERPPGDARGARPAGARGARGGLPALAPVGLDRRPARRRLRRQLPDHQAPRGPLLRP